MKEQPKKDPVCGMNVAVTATALKAAYREQTFYFCSKHCKAKFEIDPSKFLAKPKPIRLPIVNLNAIILFYFDA